MLVKKPAEGASLARALGKHDMVLMKRHGVTAVGTSVKMCVFRSIFSSRNAEYQVRGMGLGTIDPLRPGEIELAGKIANSTTGLDRAWEYWLQRLMRAGLLPG
jgi:ribulose-5-phosphate 4-epimerase/fuculose-1-phosphate aldolase